jgi:hypothetical protein
LNIFFTKPEQRKEPKYERKTRIEKGTASEKPLTSAAKELTMNVDSFI